MKHMGGVDTEKNCRHVFKFSSLPLIAATEDGTGRLIAHTNLGIVFQVMGRR